MIKAAAALHFNGNAYVRLEGGIFEKSFGTSDPDGTIALNSQTRFNIASAGKMFTAVGIGRLVDEGLIQFDSPISAYLNDLKPDLGAITIAQLLNHTSGLGNYFDPRNGTAIENARTATDLLSLALREPLAFVPGSKRAYSNSGFVVLGAIIEKISGMSYEEFTRQQILDPLKMQHTSFDAKGAAIPVTRMSPDGRMKDPQTVPAVFLRSSPAGGIYSTARDMGVFLSALIDGRLVAATTASELFMPRGDPAGGDTVYGYGFNVRSESPRRIGHGGGAPGINAEVAIYPESGREIIVLSNRDPPSATRMATLLEKVIFASDPGAACNHAITDERQTRSRDE